MILKNKTSRIAGLDLDETQFTCDHNVTDEETKKLLAVSTSEKIVIITS